MPSGDKGLIVTLSVIKGALSRFFQCFGGIGIECTTDELAKQGAHTEQFETIV